MIEFLKKKFKAPSEGAFPGDTYIQDLYKASNTGRPWVRFFLIVLILAFFADLYFLFDTVKVAFNIGSTNPLTIFAWIVAGTLVLLYLFVSIVFGKKLSEYMAFRDTSSLVSTIVALAILVLALASLTVFRLSSEISAMGDGQTKVSVLQIIAGFFSILASPKYVDPVSKVFVMTLIMSLSAIIGAIYAYYGSDAVSGRIYRISLSELPKDRALYNKIFLKNSNNIETERNYDLQEWKIDKQAVDSAFKLGSIASQLNGMVDPADAHDFLEAQKLIGSDYFNERG